MKFEMKMRCSKHYWSTESKTLQHLHVVVAALLQYALSHGNKKYIVRFSCLASLTLDGKKWIYGVHSGL